MESYFFFPPLLFIIYSPPWVQSLEEPTFSPSLFFSSLFFLPFFFSLLFLSSSNFFLPPFSCFLPFFFLLFFSHSFYSSSFFPPAFSSYFCCFLFSLSSLYLFSWLLPPYPLLSLSHVYICLFSFSPINHFFLYLFHLFAKGAAIK